MQTLGPAKSWRLVYDGSGAIHMLAEVSGYTETTHSTFEAQTLAECLTEAKRLGLQLPDEYAAIAAVPPSVSMRQASRALLEAGLLDDVEALVATLPRKYQIDWERASIVQRDNPLVEIVRQQQGMTAAQIDDLFTLAATL